jgi:hypothetical protein
VRARLLDVIKAVSPLVGTVIVLQLAFVEAPGVLLVRFAAGSALVVTGMTLLFTGIDLGVLPMGRFIGAELPRRGSLALILAVAFGLGCATTIAEPDVLVLSGQVEAASGGDMRAGVLAAAVAAGVGLFAALALFRVVRGFSMRALLSVVYIAMLALSFLAPAALVPLAYDAGSVTTGVLTAPVVLSLALGLSAVLGERSAVADGFGLLGLASVGPIVIVLVLGMLFP